MGDLETRQDYFKSLTTSMTLDRKSSFKKQHEEIKAAKERSASPRLGRLDKRNQGGQPVIPVVQEPVQAKKKKPRGFSKIAILSSFFEKKAADLAASTFTKDVKTGFWRLPLSFGRKRSRK